MSIVYNRSTWEAAQKTEKEIARLEKQLNANCIKAEILKNELNNGVRKKPNGVSVAEWREQKQVVRLLGTSEIYNDIDNKKQKKLDELEKNSEMILRIIEYHNKMNKESAQQRKESDPAAAPKPAKRAKKSSTEE